MATAVDIANKALNILGQTTIISLSENSATALACRTQWEMLVRSVLRGHKWNSVKRRAVLARLLETPAFGFKYYYQLPAKCLMALKLDSEELFEIEGRKLLTDAEVCHLHFIEQTDDATMFDPQLAHALSYLLASELCFQMTSSSSEADRLSRIGQALLADAKASDAFEGKQKDKRGGRLLRAHLG